MATIIYTGTPEGWFWVLVTDDGKRYSPFNENFTFYPSKEECLANAESFRASAAGFPSAPIVETDSDEKYTPLAFNYKIETLPRQEQYRYRWAWNWMMEDGTQVYTIETAFAYKQVEAKEACLKRIGAFLALSSQIAAAQFVEQVVT